MPCGLLRGLIGREKQSFSGWHSLKTKRFPLQGRLAILSVTFLLVNFFAALYVYFSETDGMDRMRG